jgi:putative DNA primase/helicase
MLDNIVEPLGFTPAMSFAYFVRSTRMIRVLSPAQHRKAELLALATEVEWHVAVEMLPREKQGYLLIPIFQGRQPTGDYRLDWAALGGELMELCRIRGEYDPAVGRGRGIWRDPRGDIVFNTGYEKHDFYDGAVERYELHEIAVTSTTDPFRYLSATPHSIPPAESPANANEGIQLFEAFRQFDWQRPNVDPKLLLGFIACATIFNILEFRPHLAVTAERGAGKSTLVRYVVQILGKDTNCLHVEADATTEPGLRQSLGFDAMPVVADEFETNGRHARDLLLLFRLASNPSSGSILKGSADGKTPLNYTPRTCALVAGISIDFENAADATRFAMVEMIKRPHTEEQRTALRSAFELFDGSTGARLARRMIDNFETFETNLSRFRSEILGRGGDDRQADLYGTLMAGYWTACYGQSVPHKDADAAIEWFVAAQENDQDERDCLNQLLGFLVKSQNATISELIQVSGEIGPALHKDHEKQSVGEAEAARTLEQHGIKTLPGQLIIANKGPGIEAIYANTAWRRSSHAKRLKRLGGTSDGNKAHKFLGVASKVTALPMSLVFPDDE